MKKINKGLLIAVMGVFSAGSVSAASVTVYQQSFTGSGVMTDVNWSALALRDFTDLNIDVSDYTVQAGRGSDYGFFAPHGARGADDFGLDPLAPGLFYKEVAEIQVDIGSLGQVAFDYIGDAIDASFRVALKVDGQWYAQAVPTVDSRDNPGPNGGFLNASFAPADFAGAANWLTVSNAAVDAVEMTLGAAPDGDLSGTVQAIGLYLENASDHMRFDNFSVDALVYGDIYTHTFPNETNSEETLPFDGWNIWTQRETEDRVTDFDHAYSAAGIQRNDYFYYVPKSSGSVIETAVGLAYTQAGEVPTVALSDLNKISLSHRADGSTVDPATGRFAILLGGQWYASDVEIISTIEPESELSAELDLVDWTDGANWREMTVTPAQSGGELSVADSVVVGTLSGDVTQFGVFMNPGNNGDHFRLYEFSVAVGGAAGAAVPVVDSAGFDGSGGFVVQVSGLEIGTEYFLMKDTDLSDGAVFDVEAASVIAGSATETLTDVGAEGESDQAFYQVTD